MGCHTWFYNRIDIDSIDKKKYREYYIDDLYGYFDWSFWRKGSDLSFKSPQDAGKYRYNEVLCDWSYEVPEYHDNFRVVDHHEEILTEENFMEIINNLKLVEPKDNVIIECVKFFSDYPRGYIKFG